MPRENNRCYGPAVLPLLVGAASVAGSIGLSKALAPSAKANVMPTATPTAGQTVAGAANKTADANNLGRAALIQTSPSGVLGTDPTGRRKLLGN